MSIGIIGFGRFGQLLVKYLSEDCAVFVSSRTATTDEIAAVGGEAETLAKVCQCEMVIPTVPISSFRGMLEKMKPYLSDNVVIDVCSVKEYPVQVMQEVLPESVGILATHPMFGPDSASDTVQGQKIVLSKIRLDDIFYKRIKTYCIRKGLKVIETTPENHDRQIARSQVLTHFIGRGLSEYGAEEIEIDTEGYKRLLRTLEVVGHDTKQLFFDLNKYNKYAAKMRKSFIQALQEIDQELQ
jgi:prephenate dehydrogenase